MKSPLAKARDKWLLSDDGKECCGGRTSGQYLQNRLERAFLAGANFSAERIKEIEAGVLQVVADSNQAQIEAAQRIDELEAENANWKKRYIEAVNYMKKTLKEGE